MDFVVRKEKPKIHIFMTRNKATNIQSDVFTVALKSKYNIIAVKEYYFAKPRMWRFDYAIPDKMVYIEVDGGRFKQRTYTNKVGQKITTIGGRHNSGKGFEDDCEKKNTASVLGWRGLTVFPETLLTNKTFEMVMDCCKINL